MFQGRGQEEPGQEGASLLAKIAGVDLRIAVLGAFPRGRGQKSAKVPQDEVVANLDWTVSLCPREEQSLAC